MNAGPGSSNIHHLSMSIDLANREFIKKRFCNNNSGYLVYRWCSIASQLFPALKSSITLTYLSRLIINKKVHTITTNIGFVYHFYYRNDTYHKLIELASRKISALLTKGNGCNISYSCHPSCCCRYF
jgi:hypothetical protein